MKQSPVWNVLSRSPGSTTGTDPSSTIMNSCWKNGSVFVVNGVDIPHAHRDTVFDVINPLIPVVDGRLAALQPIRRS